MYMRMDGMLRKVVACTLCMSILFGAMGCLPEIPEPKTSDNKPERIDTPKAPQDTMSQNHGRGSKSERPMITRVTATDTGWNVSVARLAPKTSAFNLEVHVNVGYVYFSTKITGNTVHIERGWVPAGDQVVIIGVYNPETGKYLSSIKMG